MLYAVPEGFLDFGKHCKIHVGDPHRQDIGVRCAIPFGTVGASAFMNHIEIVRLFPVVFFHFIIPF